MTVQEATRALHVSPATLRRWASAGRIASIPTPGGHRRFPISEIERLRGELSIVDAGHEVATAPTRALPELAAFLFEHGGRVMTEATLRSAVSLAAYSGGRGQRCLDAFGGSCRLGDYEPARRVYLASVREALLDGATFVQCMRHFYYFAQGVHEGLADAGVGAEDRAGWKMLFEHLTESALSWLSSAPTGATTELASRSAAWPLIDHIHVPCAVIESDGRVIAANLALAELLSRDTEAIAGAHASDVLPRRHQQAFEQMMNAAGSEGLYRHVGQVVRASLVRSDGAEVSVDVVLDPADDAEPGGPLLAMVIDRRAVAAAAARLARLELFMEKAPVAAYLVAADLTICSWNAAARELLGYEPGEILGRSVRQLVPDEEEELLRVWRGGVIGGQDAYGLVGRRVARDGTLVDVLLDLVLIHPDPSDEPIVGVFLRPR